MYKEIGATQSRNFIQADQRYFLGSQFVCIFPFEYIAAILYQLYRTDYLADR